MKRELGLSAVILSIMLVRQLADGKISKRLQYSLWIFVPVYFAISTFVSIPVTIPKTMQQGFESSSVMRKTAPVSNQNSQSELRISSDGTDLSSFARISSVGNTESETAERDSNTISINIWEIMRHIMWAGFLVLMVTVLLQNLLFAVVCRKKARYLGRDRETQKNHIARRYAVLHEFCHFKQGDAFWPMVRFAFIALNWYNPLAWMAGALARRDSELACDEAVIFIIGEEHRREYGETLIQMAGRANGIPTRLTMSTQMGEKGKSMKERIRSIARGTKHSASAAVLSMLVVVLTAGCALAQPKTVESQSTASTAETVAEIDTEEAASASETTDTTSSGEPANEGTLFEYFPGDAGGSALFMNEKAYFADGSGIHELELSSGTQTDLVDVPSRLSNINNKWMYYYKDTWENEPYADSGIYRMNLDTKEEQELIADDGTRPWNRWNIDSFYGEESYLYLSLVNTESGGLTAFKLSDDGTAIQTEDSPLHQLLGEVGVENTEEELNSLVPGWIPALIHYRSAAYLIGNTGSGNYSVEILDADGQDPVTVDDVLGNVFPTCRGLVYQTTDFNVHLLPWGAASDLDEVIFDSAAEGFRFNYASSDAEGIYGYGSSSDGNTYFYRVGFDKTVMQLKNVTKLASDGILVQAGLCGGNDWYGYYDFASKEQVISKIKY